MGIRKNYSKYEVPGLDLGTVVDEGNVTSRTIQLTNTGTSLISTGDITANAFIGDSININAINPFSDPEIIKIGQDIIGESTGDEFGYSVALSSNGSRLVVGAPYYDFNDVGRVRVYEWNGTNWDQIGQDIIGLGNGSQLGKSVSITPDGSRIVVGAPNYSSFVPEIINGLFRVYEWNAATSEWDQIGTDVIGQNDFALGQSVAISPDGSRVVGGGGSRYGGGVSTYTWNGSQWVLEQNLAPYVPKDSSVAISSDGSRIIVGAPYFSPLAINQAGRVYTFEWDGFTWAQLGPYIEGSVVNHQIGYSVALSSDGSRIIVGALGTSTRVYEWDAVNIQWSLVGQGISGESAGDQFGQSVAMSSDGSRIVIGAPNNGGTGSGYVRVYFLTGSMWIQDGTGIDGEAAGDNFGWSVAMSSDSSRLAIGGKGYDGTTGDINDNRGHVRVYRYYNDINTINTINIDTSVGIFKTNPRYSLDVVGDIYATGNIVANSDKRNKTNLQIIQDALNKVSKFNGYTYEKDGTKYTGLVAQEVLEVLPEAVVGNEKNGYGLAYGNMVGILVEAIKELKNRIDVLEKRPF
jgi:hypothetical protein